MRKFALELAWSWTNEQCVNPSQLLNTLVSFYILCIDHSSYSRSGEQALGTWDVLLNVRNVEVLRQAQ